VTEAQNWDVVIFDDVKPDATPLRNFLRAHGLSVKLFTRLADLEQSLAAGLRARCVIFDFLLAAENETTLPFIKQHVGAIRAANIRIIVLTADRDSGDLAEARRIEGVEVMRRPLVDRQALVRGIIELLGRPTPDTIL